MAKQERSAGVIVYRVAGSPPVRQFLLLDYGRYWDYAKGHVEAGEDDRAAALREVREETGITDVSLDDTFDHELKYFFRSKRGLVRKTVRFYLGRTKTKDVTISDEHVGYAWLPFAEALERLGYETAKAALQAAGEVLGER